MCIAVCPCGALYMDVDSFVKIDYVKCNGCGRCVSSCPYGALKCREVSEGADVISYSERATYTSSTV